MLKNVTVTMEEGVLHAVRIEAAKEGKSVSKFIGEEMKRLCGGRMSRREAMESFLAGPKWPLSDENGKLPTRDDAYDVPARFR